MELTRRGVSEINEHVHDIATETLAG